MGRIGGWIQTFTGKRFHPLDAKTEDVDIGDIAHALSNICRFTGHVSEFYSVAQHSVYVSHEVPEQIALPALLHDAAEAYLGDIARPWKRNLYVGTPGQLEEFYEEFGEAEKRLERVIFAALGVRWPTDYEWDRIKRADNKLLVSEAVALLSPLDPDWDYHPNKGSECTDYPVRPVGPRMARMAFMQRFMELTNHPVEAAPEGSDAHDFLKV